MTWTGVFITCGGAMWLSTPGTSRDVDVLVDLRNSRATVRETGRITKLGVLDVPSAQEATFAVLPLLERTSRVEWRLVNAQSIGEGVLNDFDVLLVPGGSGRLKAEQLGDDGKAAIRDFVSDGGGYVGICGGAFLATSGYEWSLGLVDAATLTGTIDCGEDGKRSAASRGGGVVSVEFSELCKGVLTGNLSRESMRYGGGPVFLTGACPDSPKFVVLARFRTEIYDCPAQRGTMVNTPAIIASKFGSGTVLLFSPHPEMSPRIEHLLIDAIAGCGNGRAANKTPLFHVHGQTSGLPSQL